MTTALRNSEPTELRNSDGNSGPEDGGASVRPAEVQPAGVRNSGARVAQTLQMAVAVLWSYPGLYDLAVHWLHVTGRLALPGGWHLQRAHLFPLGVDGGIVTAFILLMSDRGQLAKAHRRELWAGMWACAGLSAVGLMTDALKAGAGWAAPLVVIPVAVGTWFLHMVVERKTAPATPAEESQCESQTAPVATPPPALAPVANAPAEPVPDPPVPHPRPVATRRPATVAAARRKPAAVVADATGATPPPRAGKGPCDCGNCSGKRVAYDTWRRHHPTWERAQAASA